MSLGAKLVAIDGPAGSGKSTVSKMLAKRLGYAFLDTGAMYRALTLQCLRAGVPLDDPELVLDQADTMDFSFSVTASGPQFYLGDQEVTADIRGDEVAANVSAVARLIPVRQWMAREQRRQMLSSRDKGVGMVAEGRDTTTVVCPEADVRVLLVASDEARVARRAQETHGKVTPELLAATRALVLDRDESDSEVSQFMSPAPGVSVIDSSDLTVNEVVDQLVAKVYEA